MAIRLEVRGGIAVVTIDRPPVNSLDLTSRSMLLETLATALADASVAALVLWGGSRVFCAGADIDEFAAGRGGAAERCLLALVNEGARLLDEGISEHASDLDVVYRHGYGFPAHRGGPKFFADTLGLEPVLQSTHRWELPRVGRWLGLLSPVDRTALDAADAWFG